MCILYTSYSSIIFALPFLPLSLLSVPLFLLFNHLTIFLFFIFCFVTIFLSTLLSFLFYCPSFCFLLYILTIIGWQLDFTLFLITKVFILFLVLSFYIVNFIINNQFLSSFWRRPLLLFILLYSKSPVLIAYLCFFRNLHNFLLSLCLLFYLLIFVPSLCLYFYFYFLIQSPYFYFLFPCLCIDISSTINIINTINTLLYSLISFLSSPVALFQFLLQIIVYVYSYYSPAFFPQVNLYRYYILS